MTFAFFGEFLLYDRKKKQQIKVQHWKKKHPSPALRVLLVVVLLVMLVVLMLEVLMLLLVVAMVETVTVAEIVSLSAESSWWRGDFLENFFRF